MFNPFKRSARDPSGAESAGKPASHPVARHGPTPPQPVSLLPEEPALPDVVEGNEPTDWALWEDSVNVLDSQMQGLTPSARIYERDKQTPSEYQDLDPFARVNKKSR
jgi:hypothetical protein